MRRWLFILIAVCSVFSSEFIVMGKRPVPKLAKPVVKNGIEYSAPIEREGFIVAKWIETNREIWSRQIYVIKHEYLYGLDADVQTCFITKLEFENGVLKVENEKSAEFAVDLESLSVTVIKGVNVIDFTNRRPQNRARGISPQNKD